MVVIVLMMMGRGFVMVIVLCVNSWDIVTCQRLHAVIAGVFRIEERRAG